MVSAARLDNLKELFVEDGLALTDEQTEQIGAWLMWAVKPIARAVSLDKMELLGKIRMENAAILQDARFHNLYDLRGRTPRKPLPTRDVPR